MNKRTFRVYFKDGNQKLFEASDMITVLRYLYFDCTDYSPEGYPNYMIVKIEEVEG